MSSDRVLDLLQPVVTRRRDEHEVPVGGDEAAAATAEHRLAERLRRLRGDDGAIAALLSGLPAYDRPAARLVIVRELGGERAGRLWERAFGRAEAAPPDVGTAKLRDELPESAPTRFALAQARALGETASAILSRKPLGPAEQRDALLGLLSGFEPGVVAAASALLAGQPVGPRATRFTLLDEATAGAARRAARGHAPASTARATATATAADAGRGAAVADLAARRAASIWRREASPGGARGDADHPAIDEALARQGAGESLPEDVRREMERRLGGDFTRVRIHRDGPAARAAGALRARAFTVGEDIFFSEQAFAPRDAAGRVLLAHELMHVVQGQHGRMAASPGARRTMSQPGDPLEREADAAASRVAPQSAPPPAMALEPEAARGTTSGSGLGAAARPGAAIHRDKDPAGGAAGDGAVAPSTRLPFKGKAPGDGGGWDAEAILKNTRIEAGTPVGKAITDGPDAVWQMNQQMVKKTADEVAATSNAGEVWSALVTASLTGAAFGIGLTFMQTTYGDLTEFDTLHDILVKTGSERDQQIVAWSKRPRPDGQARPADAAPKPDEQAGAPGAQAAPGDLLAGDALKAANEANEGLVKSEKFIYHQLQSMLGVPLAMARGAAQNGVTGLSQAPQRWADVLGPTSQALARRQTQLHLSATGIADDATLQALGFVQRGKTWLFTRSKEEWAALDEEQKKKVLADEAQAAKTGADPNQPADARRGAIVALARAQIGTVDQSDRGDGKKYGGERIERYYEVVFGAPKGTKEQDIEAANRFANDTERDQKKARRDLLAGKATRTDGEQKELEGLQKLKLDSPRDHLGDWSWCGIFALYCVKAATGVGQWVAGQGPDKMAQKIVTGKKPEMLAKAQPGDILAIDSTNNHHVLLAEAPSADGTGVLSTVEGNIEAQGVRESQRFDFKNVTIIYKPF